MEATPSNSAANAKPDVFSVMTSLAQSVPTSEAVDADVKALESLPVADAETATTATSTIAPVAIESVDEGVAEVSADEDPQRIREAMTLHVCL